MVNYTKDELITCDLERLKYVNERIEYWEGLPSFKFAGTEAREESKEWRRKQVEILTNINKLAKGK